MNHGFHPRRAFTLFEVSLSLTLVSFGVVSVLIMLPSGIKAQQMARYQIIAAAKAMELVEAYNATHNGNPAVDIEAKFPWDVHINNKNLQPDLESRVASYRYGMFPLPTDIAKRFDSDGDEIQRVLAEGGDLYYSQPLATTGFQENGFAPTTPPNEAQRLVMAVVGYPQNNALLHLPEKAWPYYAAYPSPPVHIVHRSDADVGSADLKPVGGWQSMLWEDLSLGTAGTALRPVHQAYWDYFQVDPAKPMKDAELVTKAQAYADKLVAWCTTNNIPAACYDGQSLLADFPSTTDRHLQVVAARIMGHAGPIMLAQGIVAAGGVTFSNATVARMHANALFLGFQFAASYPYDWGAPRPLQRAIMMDTPLIEYDLLAPPRSGTIFGSSKSASQWHPVTPQPVIHAGVSMTYPNAATPWATLWSPTANSTLTAPFEPTERCRQIVFWAVDWLSYVDCETAPSAPVDAGRYSKYAPHPGKDFAALCGREFGTWMDHHMFGYRNPEKMIAFNSDMSGLATGTSTPPGKSAIPGVQGRDDFGAQTNDQGLGVNEMKRFVGYWGADRNANQKLDRGTVPRSTRLRAMTVARFNYYDLRVPAVIR
jgi:hypothetical protein